MFNNIYEITVDINQTILWKQGEGKYKNYRIPSIITTKNGTVLAFCEGREAGDTGNIDVLIKRSNDNGKTWSKSSLVWDDEFNTCGNPTPVQDLITGRIWLFMTWNNGNDNETQIINNEEKCILLYETTNYIGDNSFDIFAKSRWFNSPEYKERCSDHCAKDIPKSTDFGLQEISFGTDMPPVRINAVFKNFLLSNLNYYNFFIFTFRYQTSPWSPCRPTFPEEAFAKNGMSLNLLFETNLLNSSLP